MNSQLHPRAGAAGAAATVAAAAPEVALPSSFESDARSQQQRDEAQLFDELFAKARLVTRP